MLTERRALIRRTWPRARTRTINLAAIPETEVVRHRDGTASVVFGGGTTALLRGLPGRGTQAASFEFIDQPEHVIRLISEPLQNRK
jgi:hypothetical protein